LRALEESCGTALLRRDTHRMSVTEAGRRLLDDAKSILAQAEEADRRLREGHTTLSGQLRLFATVAHRGRSALRSAPGGFAAMETEGFVGPRRLCRSTRAAGARWRLHRLRRPLPDE
jgi:DNA-binding transcriptional LysR family regulator